jgi:hypothetical protein
VLLFAVDLKTSEALCFESLGFDPARPFLKADEEPGDRWVSIGQDGAKHPILIRPVKGSEGSYHVVGGAEGKLNGLKLHNIKSPEEYRQQSMEKAKEKRADEKAELASMTPEERKQHKIDKVQKQAGRREAESSFADTVLGPAPAVDTEGMEPAEVKKVMTIAHRERLKLALKTARDVEKKVLLDADVRMASGLDTSQPKESGQLGAVNIDDIVTQKGLARGPGYQRGIGEMAEKNGLTAESLADAVQDIKERSALEQGKPLPPKDTPPGAGVAAEGAEAFEANQAAQVAIKELKQAQVKSIRDAIQESIQANAEFGQVLTARAALRDAYREAAKKATGRVFEPGFQLQLEEPNIEAMVDTLEETYLRGSMKAFLDEVERDTPAEEYLNLTDAQSEEGLHATRGAAAFDALHEVALATLGQGAIDRDVVEVLGPEGAAQVVSMAIRQAFTPEDQKQILAALEEHHVEDQKASLGTATKEAADLRSKAHDIELELATTAKDLSTAAEMTHNKLEILKEARRTLGGTLGRIEARAALIASLRGAPNENLVVPMGRMTPARAVQTAAAMGLKQGDYKIDHAMGEATLTLTGKGQDSLIAPVDEAARGERELAMSVKRGQVDEDKYLPQGFSARTGSRFDNPIMEPPALQTKLELPEGVSHQDMKATVREHVGSRLAEGQRPEDIIADLTHGQGAKDLGPEVAAQVQGVVDSITPADHEALIQEYMDANGIKGEATFHGQSVPFDHPDTREALHRALAEDPRLRAAHIPDSELTTAHEKDLKDYYLREVAKVEPGAVTDPEGKAAAIQALGEEPDPYDLSGQATDDLGMDPQTTTAYKAHQEKLRQIDRQFDAGGAAWQKVVAEKGGLKGAYSASREAMGSQFADRFGQHYQDVTGNKLRTGTMESGRKGLGMTLEAQIRAAMPDAGKPFEGMKKGVKLAQGVDMGAKSGKNMDGQFVSQQRAIKGIAALRKMGLFYGAGSGKTPIMLGSMTSLHAAGKLKKGILAVPSIVQAQFGSEAAKFIDPSTGFNVHARPGETFEQRLAAYKDPEKHAVVVTHQSLRDDSLAILGKQKGMDAEATSKFVMSASAPELAKALKASFDAEGIDFNTLMIDEGHDALNRKGKPDSTLARILDAHAHAAEYYVPATGSPVKNDPSEAFDWLQKLDPQRYPKERRDEFMRRYGVDTPLTRRSMKQEISRYFFADRVDPGVGANNQDVTVPLGASQLSAIGDIEKAAAKLRTGDADVVKWARILAPEAFEGKDETQAAVIAEKVKRANGTYRESKLDSIINSHPDDNAKVAKCVEMAKDYVAKGKPMVIFAHRLQSVAVLEAQLKAAGLTVTSITGKHSATEKSDRAAQFMGSPGKPPTANVIVLSDAAATGLNLQRGKALIHLDQPMTYKTHEQRTARILRLGQSEDVDIFNMLSDHPFDKQARDRVKRKEVLAGIYQSPAGYVDDSGFAETLHRVKIRATQGEAA